MRTIAILAILIALASCGQADPALTITNATVSAAPNSAAIYATIGNKGGSDRLTGIQLEDRVPISLHETTMTDGVMRMRSVESLGIPANGKLELKSGGAHGMATGQIAAGAPTIPLTFRFARHSPITVRAEVTGPGGMKMEHQK